MSCSYITPAKSASAEVTIEKSRFIAYVKPVSSRDEAEAFISTIRELDHDATHNVPVYVIGKGQDEMWSSEDGEPQGTAGAPVLKMLLQEGLSDVCIVITRYFGGIKLGTGGLVRAYTQVAKAALQKAGRSEVKDMLLMQMSCGYKTYNRIEKYDFSGRAIVRNPRYLDTVQFEFVTDPDDEEEMIALLRDVSGDTVRLLEKMITQIKIMC
ncbi:MAG: YigZ family protein [Eubacterium sp.]|nr:YigZ family protein [Eubacterium sp.]